jgi:peptide-methionine (S)-S-oxide reductase
LREIVMFKELAGFRTLLIGAVLIGCGAAAAEEPATRIPPPALDDPAASAGVQKAVLAGGCYWGTQGIFEHVNGVRRVIAGFTGGRSDADGGVESVMISFDPKVISYGQLLQIFFSVVHDPTQLDRQGPDIGASYRSEVFYMNEDQRRVAQAYIAQLEDAKVFTAKIVTRVDALTKFHQVDLDQQDFMIKNPSSEYVVVNDRPKLAGLKQLFPAAYKDYPVAFR